MSNDPILHLIGLAKKGGKLEVGEEPVGAACRARQAKLVLLAGDSPPTPSAGPPTSAKPAGYCGWRSTSPKVSWAAVWAAPPVQCWP